jgi:hypothetical protein
MAPDWTVLAAGCGDYTAGPMDRHWQATAPLRAARLRLRRRRRRGPVLEVRSTSSRPRSLQTMSAIKTEETATIDARGSGG